MKTRIGMVSNSSTSSFVVTLRTGIAFQDQQNSITQDEIDLLLRYGFKPAEWHTPTWIQAVRGEIPEVPIGEASILYYYVICNQDDVMQFLVEENIPFVGNCHYGSESVFFSRGEKEVIVIPNLGTEKEAMAMLNGKPPTYPSQDGIRKMTLEDLS